MSELPASAPSPLSPLPAPVTTSTPTGEVNAAHVLRIAQETGLAVARIAAVAKLFAEGATVPFIARYRKEVTGEMDEVQITTVRDRMEQLKELDSRRAAILKSLEENKHLTPELKKKVEAAETVTALEDLYLPYRPKRRTRATIAVEKGLAPLADFILANQDADPEAEAAKFVTAADAPEEKRVLDTKAALAGARDIIAEKISDDAGCRAECRAHYMKEGLIASEVVKGKEEEGAKFRDYFEWKEPLAKAPSHRVLAMRRGEKEGFLFMRITAPEEQAIAILDRAFVVGRGPAAAHVAEAAKDSWKRLLGPSLETEARLASKKKADEEGIRVFGSNIVEILMAPALGQKRVLALDPGFRSGCKLVILDAQGKLIHDEVIHPTAGSEGQKVQAGQRVTALCALHAIEAIAIGNGTASRESESFVRSLGLPPSIVIVMVNESGASIYSASEVAREEFPDKDITVRGAVSIGRRLMDPLAELVKLDPKSIGVGQYQHDVDQNALKKSLDDVVVSCVNKVGVELNTASKQLLTQVSGMNSTLAGRIVAHRNEKGAFTTRDELRKVTGFGPKTFEQAAGFLRIRGGAHPLDSSSVHPERYALVEKMAADIGVDVATLLRDGSARAKIKLDNYVSDTVGLPTLRDILKELEKPGRDPREKFETFAFADGVNDMKDLKEGMRLPGIVTNVTAFGAFVDIGVHQDGLVHVSQLSDKFVENAAEVVKPGQKVSVVVVEVDMARKRIALTMKTNSEKSARGVRDQGTGYAAPQSNRFGKPAANTPPPRTSSGGSFGNNPFGGNAFGSLGDKFGKK
jgi:uncharacterized protein